MRGAALGTIAEPTAWPALTKQVDKSDPPPPLVASVRGYAELFGPVGVGKAAIMLPVGSL